MAQQLFSMATQGRLSQWLGNIVASLWQEEAAMMQPSHPLLADRMRRTPGFQLGLARHQRIYGC